VTKPPSLTVIDLLRHGDVEGGRKYRGQQDDPLSELGWQQLREVTEQKQAWQHIVTSPLKRCASFAGELAQKYNLPVQTNEFLKEISFGQWEGKTADELLSLAPDHIKHYWSDPVNFTPPEGENLLDFEKRILQAWHNLVASFEAKHILVVTHAGVIRIILCHVLGMPLTEIFKLDVALARASRIEITKAGDEYWPRLIFHGSQFNV
jgi:alpha-ribazole phosphatase/probable phosphoglycerate mutase